MNSAPNDHCSANIFFCWKEHKANNVNSHGLFRIVHLERVIETICKLSTIVGVCSRRVLIKYGIE